jgi:hypothetical protein
MEVENKGMEEYQGDRKRRRESGKENGSIEAKKNRTKRSRVEIKEWVDNILSNPKEQKVVGGSSHATQST